MKKLLLTAILTTAAMSLSAADYVVYQDGKVADGLNVYGWWNNTTDFNAADPAGGDAKVMLFKAADGGAAASFGIHAPAESGITGPLHNASLTFDFYATTQGQTYSIRLTGESEQDLKIVTDNTNTGKWVPTTLPVNLVWDKVAADWKDYKKSGDGYVFSIVLDGGTAESVFYVRNLKYTNIDETWVKPAAQELPKPTTVPVPGHDAETNSVVSLLSGKYQAACSFGIGGWGQSTQIFDETIDGTPVKKVKFFNYLGWELNPAVNVENCNMVHIDWFPANEGNFGFTPISPGKEKAWVAPEVKVGEWNSYDVPLSHWDNVDLTNVFQVKFDQGNGNLEGYIANVYFYNDGTVVTPVDYNYGNKWYGVVEGSCTKGDKTYDITANYTFTATEEGLEMEFVFEGEDDLEPGHQVHIVKAGGDQWVTLAKNGDAWEGVCTLPFTLKEAVTEMEIYLPYAGGVWHPFIRDYKFGAANEAPKSDPKLKLTASVSDVTAESAVITYNVKASNHFDSVKVDVLLNGSPISESPYTLSGLAELTEYNYTLVARATLDEIVYESEPVALSFRTKSATAVAKTYHAIVDGTMKNVMLAWDSSIMQDVNISIETEVTYNTDGTITVVATPHTTAFENPRNIEGFVPKVTVSSGEYKSEYVTMQTSEDGKWSMTTATVYPEDHQIGWLFFQLAYLGGDAVINVPGYRTGMENDAPAYGSPVSLEILVAPKQFAVNQEGVVTPVVKDAAGHYLFYNDLDVTMDGGNFATAGENLLIAREKGAATLSCKLGDLTASVQVLCVLSAEATKIQHEELLSNHDNPSLAFDDNEGTQVEWNCSESENHYLSVDLGKKMNIEAIELVWEGASATHYTVRLHNPEAIEPLRIARVEAKDGHVFTVENGEGGAGVTARKMLFTDDFSPVAAQYVTLETSKAYNAGWGIKLKEMRIMGTDANNTSTIVESIVNFSDTVDVYTLDGVRVLNGVKASEVTTLLPKGLYIVDGKKMLVK